MKDEEICDPMEKIWIKKEFFLKLLISEFLGFFIDFIWFYINLFPYLKRS